jgi:hypothetical protein
MDDNIFDNKNEKINIDIKNNSGKNMNCNIFDQSYQDYILDLGDDIYLYEQNESIENIS